MKSLILHLRAHLHFLRTQILQQLQPTEQIRAPVLLASTDASAPPFLRVQRWWGQAQEGGLAQ